MSYLTFEETPNPGKKTLVWMVRGKAGDRLGRVMWYAPWRRYTYSPSEPQVLDAACLTELAGFLTEQMEKRKTGGNNEAY